MQNAGSFFAIAFGAILATLCGFLSGRLNLMLEEKRRSRAAALLCIEVLKELRFLLNEIGGAHGRGDPFGKLTLRLMRAARREIEVYERNREATFALRDSDPRARIHALMLRLAVPLEFMIEEGSVHRDAEAPDRQRIDLEETYAYFQTACALIPDMLSELKPLSFRS